MTKEELMILAISAREKSYSPYSQYSVGAALLTESGKVYQGCNVENASYGASICAERAAAVKAVYDGHTVFKAIAVAGGKHISLLAHLTPAYPCGICRQFLSEFASPDMKVYLGDKNGKILTYTLEELLPHSFKASDMNSETSTLRNL